MINSLISLFHLDNTSLKLVLTSIQPRDFLDIIFTALMIYILIWFLRRTKSLPVVLGVFILLLAYSLSYLLNLSLTYRILQTFLGALVIILVIIFQEEIKRFFYLLGSFNIYRKNQSVLNNESLENLVNATWRLASKKIGALMVIPGKELISPYIIGGIDINAKITEPLLLALFNTESPTHDGALIINKNLIEKYGVYLPLSKDLEQLKGYGTRHRAGLGISEKSDALSIIVSEEKGTVSIALNGKLTPVHSKEELKEILNKFLNTISNSNKRNSLFNIINSLINNVFYIILALILASLFWLSFAYPNLGIVQKNFTVPIEFINVPNNFVVKDLKPMEVTVTLAGKNQDFKLLDQNSIKVVIDLKDITKKDKYFVTLTPSNIKYPSVLEFIGFEPKKIQFTIEEKANELNSSSPPLIIK